jgi:hypothetical protein
MQKNSALIWFGMAWYLGLVIIAAPSRQATRSMQPETTFIAPRPVAMAEAYLGAADRLYAVQVGYAGTTPPQVLAWRIILENPDADVVFQRLLQTGTRPAKVYALAGLEWLHSPAFPAASARLRAEGGDVDVTIGCVPSTESLSGILDEVAQGHWAAEFIVGKLLPRSRR